MRASTEPVSSRRTNHGPIRAYAANCRSIRGGRGEAGSLRQWRRARCDGRCPARLADIRPSHDLPARRSGLHPGPHSSRVPAQASGADRVTDVVYRIDEFHAPNSDVTARHDDPDLAIAWPAPATIKSARDRESGISWAEYRRQLGVDDVGALTMQRWLARSPAASDPAQPIDHR
jgi:hypothetical protein